MAYESVSACRGCVVCKVRRVCWLLRALMAAVPHRASAQVQQPPLAVVTAEAAAKPAAAKA